MSIKEVSEMSPEEIETEARTFGWTPEEEFRGDKSKWIPAEDFVERGRRVVPILNANNKRLQQQVLTANQKVDTLQSELAATRVAIEKLEKHYTESNKRQLEDLRNSLKSQLKEAREDGNVDDEVQILGQLQDVDKTLKETKENPTPPASNSNQTPPQPNADPVLQNWMKENKDWFGPDKKKTKEVTRIAEDLREDNPDMPTAEFLEEVMRLYDERHAPKGSDSDDEESSTPPQRRTPSKVEGAPQARSGSAKSKSWESLPADAKQACLQDADDLVGPGKRYKTLDEWKSKYATIYYGD